MESPQTTESRPSLPYGFTPPSASGVWVLLSALVVVIGSLGAWVETPAGNIYGAQGIGWIGALLGGFALVASVVRILFNRASWPLVFVVFIGIGGFITAVFLWIALRTFGAASWIWNTVIAHWSSSNDLGRFHASTGWGLYLLLFGSLSLTISPLFLLASEGRAKLRQRSLRDRMTAAVDEPKQPASVSDGVSIAQRDSLL